MNDDLESLDLTLNQRDEGSLLIAPRPNIQHTESSEIPNMLQQIGNNLQQPIPANMDL